MLILTLLSYFVFILPIFQANIDDRKHVCTANTSIAFKKTTPNNIKAMFCFEYRLVCDSKNCSELANLKVTTLHIKD